MRAFISAAILVHRRFELAPTMACTRQVQCDDVPLKNDGADSLLIVFNGARKILFRVVTAFEFQVMYGLKSKDTSSAATATLIHQSH